MAIFGKETLLEYDWNNIVVGESLGRAEGVIDERLLALYEAAVGTDGEWYNRDSTINSRVVHPLLLTNDVMRLFMLNFDCRPGYLAGLHARNKARMIAPLMVGQKAIVTGMFSNKFTRRGVPYRTVSGTVSDEQGRLLLEIDALESIGFGRSDEAAKSQVHTGEGEGAPPAEEPWPKIAGEVPSGAPVAASGDTGVQQGTVLPAVSRIVGLEESVIFSGFPFGWASPEPVPVRRSTHTDHEIARSKGFDRPLVQGLISANHMAEVVGKQFGSAWTRSGLLDTKFIGSVLAGQKLTSQALVRSRVVVDEGEEIKLDLWTKDETDRLVTVGRASLTVGGS